MKIIAINRPNKRNAVNQATAQELYDVFCALEEDESVRVAVLCGRGGTFCAGYDLSELANAETIVPKHTQHCLLYTSPSPRD